MVDRRVPRRHLKPTVLPSATSEEVQRALRMTPVRDDVLFLTVPREQAPRLQIGLPMPDTGSGDATSGLPRLSLNLRARLPQYDTPSYWSHDFDFRAPICCTFYRRLTIASSFKVPADKMVVIDGVSFTQTGLQPGEIFEVSLRVSGQQRVTFEEMYVGPYTAEPSGQFAFSSQIKPLPVWVPVDHDQVLTVLIRVLGLYPFAPVSPIDGFCGNITTLLSGWQSPIQDNRDGAPRPIDQGSMRDLATGLTDAMSNVQSTESFGRDVAFRYGV